MKTSAVAAAAAGAATVLGFEPAGLSWLPVVTLALLSVLWARTDSPRSAAWIGYLFGLGYFGAGVSWVYVSLHDFGMMPAPLAVAATIFFCAYLALFPALVGSLQARFPWRASSRLVVLVPSLWVGCEWIRGWLFTGFPWIAAGYSQTDTPLAGYSPLVGVYGVSFVLLLAAALLAVAIIERRFATRATALVAALLVHAAGYALEQVSWTQPAGEAVPVALLQGNVEQNLKFDPARYQATLDTYARLARESSGARLIVFPETAIPRMIDLVDPAYLDALESLASQRGADIVIGAPFRDTTGRYFNGGLTVGASGVQWFAKRHLVPLGEFVPPEFRWIVSFLSIPLSDFSRATAPQIVQGAGQPLAMTICYEDAFGEEVIQQLPRATLLLNMSNVAWFGRSLAPDQHLQMSRMRSMETGRYMLRATNTGVTALIDERGHVVSRLPEFTEGVLRGEARPFSGATPYVLHGNRPVLAACALILLASLLFSVLPLRSRRPDARQ